MSEKRPVSRGRRALMGGLAGAAVALAYGLISGAIVHQPGGYHPQTEAGVVAEFVGYMIPWAFIGALIGFFPAKRKP